MYIGLRARFMCIGLHVTLQFRFFFENVRWHRSLTLKPKENESHSFHFISHNASFWSSTDLLLCVSPGPDVIQLFPRSTQLSTKFILLINVKMPTIVGILTFISRINATSERLSARNFLICVCEQQRFWLIDSSSMMR